MRVKAAGCQPSPSSGRGSATAGTLRAQRRFETLNSRSAVAGRAGARTNPAYIDSAHRVHARVEDGIRAGKDCGIGRFPSHAMAMNKAWFAAALIAAALLAWLRLLALDGAHPRRPQAAAENTGQLALGRRHRHRLEPHQRPGQLPLTGTPRPSRRPRHPRNLRNPPATRPASRATVTTPP